MTTQSIASGMPRAWVHVDLGALVRNGAALARHARVPLVPMVKADGSGAGGGGRGRRAAGVPRLLSPSPPPPPGEAAATREAGLTPALGDPGTVAAWLRSRGGPGALARGTGKKRAGGRGG